MAQCFEFMDNRYEIGNNADTITRCEITNINTR